MGTQSERFTHEVNRELGLAFVLFVFTFLPVTCWGQKHAAVLPQPTALQAAFGRAALVVEGRLTDVSVYNKRGESIEPLPDSLRKRQYLELAVTPTKVLYAASGPPAAPVVIRLEAVGLPVASFLFPLTTGTHIFLLKRSYQLPDVVFYYPADPRLFTAEASAASQITAWATQRIKSSTVTPPSSVAYYHVPGATPLVLQEGPQDCWAAAAAMMLSWRDQRLYTRKEAAAIAGSEFSALLSPARTPSGDQGIVATTKKTFLARLGMQEEAPQNFTAQGWRELLLEHGPLWVTTSAAAKFFLPHARIVVAIEGDGSPYGTFLTFLDPNANAQLTKQNLQAFTEFYESVAKGDLKLAEGVEKERRATGNDTPVAQPFRPQILHF